MRGFLAVTLLLSGLAVARLFVGAPAPTIALSTGVASDAGDLKRSQTVSPAPDREAAAVLASPEPVMTAAREVAGDAGPLAQVSEAVASCQQAWDPFTHMTEAEWAQTCQRIGDGGASGPARW